MSEEQKNTTTEEIDEERLKKYRETREKLEKASEEAREKIRISNEALTEGKGVLKLETPITSADGEITELPYDFTVLTGLEFTEAMDSDMNAQQIFRITSRQALALFAVAAARQTPSLDRRDIMERIGMTDSVAATQVATLFFSASTRAGRLRISKK